VSANFHFSAHANQSDNSGAISHFSKMISIVAYECVATQALPQLTSGACNLTAAARGADVTPRARN